MALPIRYPATPDRLPILTLLDPRTHTRRVLVVLAMGVMLATLAVRVGKVPLWCASAAVLLALVAVLVPKWREDWRRYGGVATALGVVATMQAVRVVEHGAQWFQLHVLRWHMLDASGLLGSADIDTLPFVWGWGLLLACAVLAVRGVRGPRMAALLAVAALHVVDSTYLVVRSVQITQELRALGVGEVGVAYLRLPGIFGRDGWLATSEFTRLTPLGRLPGIATAPRQDIQFWWAVLELALILPLANSFVARPRRPHP